MAGATIVFSSREGRKAAKITRADDNCRFDYAKLRWSLKGAKVAARPHSF